MGIKKTLSKSDIRDKELALRIRELIEGGKLYLNPDLSKETVAAELKEDSCSISRAFSLFAVPDFELYLNELRVMYAAILFMGRDSFLYSIEETGKQSGFSDLNTFNHACRELTGMSPESVREFAHSRHSLKGLFLNEPIYICHSLTT